MSPSKNTLPEGQSSLFEPGSLYNTQIPGYIDGYNIPISFGQEGSYINVKERAAHLISALDAMSQRNMRDGISVAAYTEPYSAPIWGEYREKTPSVLDGASRNRTMYQEQLRWSFWHATGFAALRGTGLINERQINPRAQKLWRDFNKEYGHPVKLKERNMYKKRLTKQLVQKNSDVRHMAA